MDATPSCQTSRQGYDNFSPLKPGGFRSEKWGVQAIRRVSALLGKRARPLAFLDVQKGNAIPGRRIWQTKTIFTGSVLLRLKTSASSSFWRLICMATRMHFSERIRPLTATAALPDRKPVAPTLETPVVGKTHFHLNPQLLLTHSGLRR